MGYHQGDIMATWMYVMTNQPMLHHIDEVITAEFGENHHSKQMWYCDDGNLHAPAPIMYRIIEILKEVGPKYGYKMNPLKGGYLIGERNNLVEAEETKAYLHQTLGLANEIIHIHPNTFTDAAAIDESSGKYGVDILGSFIGTDKFIQSKLNEYYDVLAKEAALLMDLPDLQQRMLLFRYSFVSKPHHIFRTIPPEISAPFASRIESLNKSILCSIIGCHVNEFSALQYESSKFPIHQAGLGLTDTFVLSKSAFIASLIDFHHASPEQASYFLNMDDVPPIPAHAEGTHISHFIQSARAFIPQDANTASLFNIISNAEHTTQAQLTKLLQDERWITTDNLIKLKALLGS
jgi:hypothetical protein